MTVRRILAALAVVSALTAGVVGAPAPPAAAATDESAPAQLVVAPRGGGVVAPGDPLVVDVEVRNTGTAPLEAGTLAFSMDQAPIASSSALLAAIAQPSRVLLGQLTTATARTPALQPGEDARVRARLDGDDIDSILTRASGARLLYVLLKAGEVQTVAESAVVRMRADAPAVGFGTVVPITAPAGTTGVTDTAQQAALTAPDGAWSLALDAARAMPTAVVALDPAVLASIRLAGEDAPESATRFLEDLDSLENEIAPLPYADGDVALQRAAGAAGSLRPTSFAGVTTTPAPSGSASPTPATTEDDPEGDAATAAALTDWEWTGEAITWPVPGTASAQDLTASGDDGIALLGAADVQGGGWVAAGPLTAVGDRRVLVADRAASRLLATAADRGMTGDAALAPLVGALAADAVTRATPAVLAVAGRSASTEGLARVLGVLADQRWIRGEGLESLTARPATEVALSARTGVPEGRLEAARALVRNERLVQQVGSAVPDPDALTGPQRLALLALLSAQWRSDDAGWAAAARTGSDAFAAFRTQVTVVDSGLATLSGVDGRLAVFVQNDLPQAVTVDVNAAVNNGRLQFTGPSSTRVEVPADSTGRVQLAFRTIANGPARVTLALTTPGGAPVGTAVVRPVAVSAGFDTIVAVVLLTLLGLLLALGVYRNIARRRRPKEER